MKLRTIALFLLILTPCFPLHAQSATWKPAIGASSGGGGGVTILNNPSTTSIVCGYSISPPYTFYIYDATKGNSSSFTDWFLVFDNKTIGSRTGPGGYLANSGLKKMVSMAVGTEYEIDGFIYYIYESTPKFSYTTSAGTKRGYSVCRKPLP